jgi:hypothetical protein
MWSFGRIRPDRCRNDAPGAAVQSSRTPHDERSARLLAAFIPIIPAKRAEPLSGAMQVSGR